MIKYYELEVKVNLSIELYADSHKHAVDQIKCWLIKEDIISDFDIIKVDGFCDEGEDD